MPLGTPAHAQTAAPPVTAPAAPPLSSRPSPDTTPPTDHPVPEATAPAPDLAAVGPPPVATAAPRPAQELVERRTATSKTFSTERPGELRTELHAGPVHSS